MLDFGSHRLERRISVRWPSALLTILLMVMVGGCNELVNGTGDGTNFTTQVATETLNTGAVNVDQIDRGQYGDIVEGTQAVLRDEEAYASFWERLHADRSAVPERPSVDFDDEVVIAIVLGQRPNGGYSAAIDEVLTNQTGDQVQVRFTETVPGDECVVTQALTSPYVLATMEARDADVTFEGAEETRSC